MLSLIYEMLKFANGYVNIVIRLRLIWVTFKCRFRAHWLFIDIWILDWVILHYFSYRRTLISYWK